MSKTYHYRIDSQVLGAVTYEEMVQLVKNGSLEPETQVSHDSQQNWFDAGHVAGLFHMAGRADEVSQWRARQRAATPVPANSVPAPVAENLSENAIHSLPTDSKETFLDLSETNASPPHAKAPDTDQRDAKKVPTADNEDWEQSGNLSREIKSDRTEPIQP